MCCCLSTKQFDFGRFFCVGFLDVSTHFYPTAARSSLARTLDTLQLTVHRQEHTRIHSYSITRCSTHDTPIPISVALQQGRVKDMMPCQQKSNAFLKAGYSIFWFVTGWFTLSNPNSFPGESPRRFFDSDRENLHTSSCALEKASTDAELVFFCLVFH